jgi:hypothetical protein
VSMSISLDNPKSATLQTRFPLISIFRAAKSWNNHKRVYIISYAIKVVCGAVSMALSHKWNVSKSQPLNCYYTIEQAMASERSRHYLLKLGLIIITTLTITALNYLQTSLTYHSLHILHLFVVILTWSFL